MRGFKMCAQKGTVIATMPQCHTKTGQHNNMKIMTRTTGSSTFPARNGASEYFRAT